MGNEVELARLLVGTQASREARADRIRDVAAQVDFTKLATLLYHQRLLPLIGTRLLSTGGVTAPERFRAQVDSTTRTQRALSMLLEATSSRATARIEQRGLRAIPLKGPVLAATLYGDLGLRASSDVDLLVLPSQLDQALEALSADDFLPPHDPLFSGRPLLHYRLESRRQSASIELHWRIHWYETQFSTELIEHSLQGPHGRIFDAGGGLAALLLFFVRDGLQGLRYPADIAAWWDRFGEEIPAGALSTIIQAHPLLERPLLAAARAAGSLVGLPTDHLLSPGLLVDRRVALAHRLVNPAYEGDRDQLESDQVLVDCLVTPPGGGWSYVQRHLLRPPLERAHQRLLHPFKVIARHVNTLARLRIAKIRREHTASGSQAVRVDSESEMAAGATDGPKVGDDGEWFLPVTVIIPAYNRAHLVPRALESVRRQAPWPPGEVIVIDDGSSDDTVEVAERLGARVIRHPENMGLSAARNTGVSEAKYPWVALLDSDDEWLPHHLATLWSHRDGHVLVANSALWCGSSPADDRLQGPASDAPAVLKTPVPLIYPDNFLPVSAAMVDKIAIERAGGFVSRNGVVEDFDLWLRLLDHGTGVVCPTVGLLYHLHGAQMSQDHDVMHAAHLAAIEASSFRPWWSPALVERFRGRSEWDKLRLALDDGDLGLSRKHAWRIVSHPQRLVGVTAAWNRRLKMRRRSGRVSRDGRPSVAALPGSQAMLARLGLRRDAVVDLTTKSSFPRAWLHLLKRPTARAVAPSRAQRLALRIVGIRPVYPVSAPLSPAGIPSRNA